MRWAGCEGRCAPRSAVAHDLTRMGNKEMKLTLAHEIRARAIACSPLGCIGHAFSDAVAAGKSRGCSFCARRRPQALLP